MWVQASTVQERQILYVDVNHWINGSKAGRAILRDTGMDKWNNI